MHEDATIWGPFSPLSGALGNHTSSDQKADGAVWLGAQASSRCRASGYLLRTVSDFTQDPGCEARVLGLRGPSVLILDTAYSGFSGYLRAVRRPGRLFAAPCYPEERNCPLFCILCHKWEKIWQNLNVFLPCGVGYFSFDYLHPPSCHKKYDVTYINTYTIKEWREITEWVRMMEKY